MRRRVRIVATLGLALGAAACAEREPAPEEETTAGGAEAEALDPALASRLPEGVTFAMAEEGQALFPICGTCHGFDARGTQLGPSLRDSEWIHSSGELQEIERIIREGIAEPEEFEIPMPVMGGGEFTDEQIRALAAYVYLLSHESG